jgi:hypothetical protein
VATRQDTYGATHDGADALIVRSEEDVFCPGATECAPFLGSGHEDTYGTTHDAYALIVWSAEDVFCPRATDCYKRRR